jgi:hypothetical protein
MTQSAIQKQIDIIRQASAEARKSKESARQFLIDAGAVAYAIEARQRQQKFSGKIKTPFVIGAIIELGNCLKLIEPNSINIVKTAYSELRNTMQDMKAPILLIGCILKYAF